MCNYFPGTLKYQLENEKYEKDDDVDDDEHDHDYKDDEHDGGDDDSDDEDEKYHVEEKDIDDYDDEHKHDIDIDSDKLQPSNIENVRQEATVLVDNVLEQSIHIVNEQQDRDHIETYNVVVDNNTRAEYNSESENYAITCDDVDGLDVIKSPTIESMSGKSFDDNLSFTDEHIATVAGPTKTVTYSVQQTHEQTQMLPSQDGDEMSGTKITTIQTTVTQQGKERRTF